MKVVGLSLQEGFARWREVSNRLLPAVKNHPEGVLAAAVPNLGLAVIVSNGWLMGRSALAVQDRLAAGDGAFAVRALACIGLNGY
ncbi:MAG: acyl-CoA dehydrogenase C-terminal domain-containing protein [Azonexus sp.]